MDINLKGYWEFYDENRPEGLNSGSRCPSRPLSKRRRSKSNSPELDVTRRPEPS